jgi:uncharacterized membrane protein (DUF4010 family)
VISLQQLISSDLVVRCLVGFAVGALIGLERQKTKIEGIAGGVRSYGLHSLFGALSAYSYTVSGNPVILIYAIAISVIIVAAQVIYRMFRTTSKGVTTSIVFALSFVLGTLVGLDPQPAAGQIIGPLQVLAMTVAFLVFLVLGFKEEVAAAIAVISREEMTSAVELGVIILFFWPLIPEIVIIGTVEVPIFTIYILVVILLSISFVNYILIKKFKSRGPYFFGFFGGFANSEATVSSLTDFYVKTNREYTGRISASTLLANIAMVIRNALIILILDPTLKIIKFYIVPILILTLIGIIRMMTERKTNIPEDEELDASFVSPFEFGAAIRFAFMFFVVSYFSLLLQEIFSDAGIILASLFGGFTSAGAVVTIACSSYVAGNIGIATTVYSIIIATTTSVLNKILYVYASDREFSLLKKVAKDSLIVASGIIIYVLLIAFGIVPLI